MGINKRYIDKYNEAYKNLKQRINPIEFLPGSEYYHKEEWKLVLSCYIPGVLEDTYFISNYGRIYTKLKSPSYPNGGIMKPSINNKGYHQINLRGIYGQKICIKISRIVMLHFAFIPFCQYFEVDHVDGNKSNNKIWNLEWVTPQENTHRAILNSQRTLCPSPNINSRLLTDKEARDLFYDSFVLYLDPLYLSNKYNVSVQYVYYISTGVIRPYLRNNIITPIIIG